MEYKHFAGQSKSVDALFTGIESGRVVHAVIIEGDEDSGKERLAKVYAKALLCSSMGQSACSHCKPCRLFDGGNHPDYIKISAGRNASVGVEDVAYLSGQAHILPNEGGRKVFVIEDAHLLTAPAQNKLLKLLEEPPHYLVIILLCGNISSILPTVLSRCIRIRMPRLPRHIIAGILESEGIDGQAVQLAASLSGGKLGLAFHYTASGIASDKLPFDIFFGINKPGGKIEACGYLMSNRQNSRRILNIWQNILRDCMSIIEGNYDIINYSDEKERMERYANGLDAIDIIKKLDMLCQAEERLLSNIQYPLLVDWLMSVV